MIRKQAFVRVAATAFALSASMALTGCFANPLEDLANQVSEGAAQQGAEDLVEEVTGGEMDVEFGEMPADFPEDVPLVSTDVVQSATLDDEDGRGIMVIVADPRDPQEVAQQIRDDFADWDEVVWSDMGELVSGQFKTDGMAVIVGAAANSDADGSAVTYMVYTD